MPETITLLRTKANTDTPDTNWANSGATPPAVASMPLGCNGALVWLHMVDGDGERLANNSTTVDVTIMPVGVSGSGDAAVTMVGDTSPLTGWSAVRVVDLAMPHGASFAVHLGALTSPPASIAAVRVYWLPYRRS